MTTAWPMRKAIMNSQAQFPQSG
uniref:Uncharacterized protein n=1 Tax=Anguilla anguilla TaxID=7936 RepID=A0A0E9VKZ3_ANGAN